MEEPAKTPEISPEPKEPKTLKQKFEVFGEKTKWFGKSWFIGSAMWFSVSIIGLIGNALGVTELNFRTISSPNDIILIISQLGWQDILFVVFAAAGIGGVGWFWMSSQNVIGKELFHMHSLAEYPNKEIEKEMIKDLRKLRILPLATFAVFVGIIILPVAGGVYTLTGINITNYHDLIKAYTGGHIIVIAINVIGAVVTGGLMSHFKGEYQKTYDKIQKHIPKGLNKIL